MMDDFNEVVKLHVQYKIMIEKRSRDTNEEEVKLHHILNLAEEKRTREDKLETKHANIRFMFAIAQKVKYAMEVLRDKINDKYSRNEEEP